MEPGRDSHRGHGDGGGLWRLSAGNGQDYGGGVWEENETGREACKAWGEERNWQMKIL